ncbi:hypothetical protein BVY05_21910 [Pectobacterium odoriferum]|nr:hypothetical protein BVY05_21910 [Pectobacterium odoriferum]
MPVRKVSQTFFRDALASTHQYRQNALIDSTTALINGATLSLRGCGQKPLGSSVRSATESTACLCLKIC